MAEVLKIKRNTKAQKVRREIIDRINRGIYTGKLPGVNQLAADFDVNPLTISKVLRNLSESGLIYQQERIGTFVGRKRRIGFLILQGGGQQQGIHAHLSSYNKIINGCTEIIEPEHLTLHTLVASPDETESIEQLKREVDAMVISTAGNVNEESLELTAGTPRIRVLGNYQEVGEYPQITYNNEVIGKLAADYLLQTGCRRFVVFGPQPDGIFASRYRNFSARIRKAGHEVTEIPLDPYYLPFTDYMAQGRKKLGEVLSSNSKTGIFVPADVVCNPLYQIIYRLGLEPEMFTIIGCDNNDYHLHGLFPRPVAIDIRMEDIGRDAARFLLDIINGKRAVDDCDKIIKTPELVLPSSIVYSPAGYEL